MGGTWKVGTYECVQAESVSRFLAVLSDSECWSLDGDRSVALVRPLPSRSFTTGDPSERRLLQ